MPSNHTDLKKFAQSARRSLREQVAARLDQVLRTDSAALREREAARKELTQQIAETSKKAVIDRVAYTWFNRFCALRFMDVNRYNRIGVISPAEGFTQPEILQEAKQGYIDEDLQAFVDCPAVFELLGGRRPSADPQQEAYRLLLVGMCNALNKVMPFLFEPIADYTELLMPQDLLSEHSILHDLREAIPFPEPGAILDVEVIGWLYQFYISERKDEVFEALKQNQKIAPEDIPAATQLFTPHWIVRYLVENALGRLWMLNRPSSRLVEKMDYYIQPEEPETDFLRVASPEEIKICDPACGSGHMLTYAFDLLYAIYEEEGYPASDIPRLILEKNLYGIEIDERAGALAAFALAMKARGRDRRFFSREVQPNICVLENITFTDQELKEYATAMGQDLFTEPLMQTLKQFGQATNFGSLILPILSETTFIQQELARKNLGSNIFMFDVHKRVNQVLKAVSHLCGQYHVVTANPPYMGTAGMNQDLKEFTKTNYSKGSSDLYGCFIERNLDFVKPLGYVGMITIPNWMFLDSFEELRSYLLSEYAISSLLHNGRGVWGPDFGSCSFILLKKKDPKYIGLYKRLFSRQGEVNSNEEIEDHFHNDIDFPFHKTSSEQFMLIPGHPIAYWVSDRVRKVYKGNILLGDMAKPRQGLASSDNNRFLRLWYEVSRKRCKYDASDKEEALESGAKWFPYNKGGAYRKWYGNNEYLINWENDGNEVLEFARSLYGSPTRTIKNIPFYFKPSITWSFVSSSYFGVRYSDKGAIFDVGGSSVFPEPEDTFWLTGFMCSKLSTMFMSIMNPTVNFQVGNVASLPIILPKSERATHISKRLIEISKTDWNNYETSWDFTYSPLLRIKGKEGILSMIYSYLRENWQKFHSEMRILEEENNQFYISLYGLQNDLTPNIQPEEVTLTCNPYYRYSGNHSEVVLEALLLADTMREFISYAVGCMFGRYSLDKPGLILANQGETLQDYARKVYDSETPPASAFLPDEDNAIPVLEGEWFSDDITERFKKFLRVTFGEAHYEENLAFIENAIGRDIRSYFLKEFYSQHVKMYQKRPIYWMFSSPKGSFNVLIYMHRYQPDTLSVILNRYLREFRGKLEGRKAHLEQVSISASASQREKTAALKEIEGLNKTLEEIRVYERDVLYPLAVQGIQIDLDDGVKVNYNKFGKALAKVPGLSE